MEKYQSDNLKLILPEGTNVDVGSKFFVRSMALDEGLGIIPTARLELCSSEPGSVVKMTPTMGEDGTVQQKGLKDYLGYAAAVEFKHLDIKDDGGLKVVSTRWMSGLVSSVEHLGVIYTHVVVEKDDTIKKYPVCGYRMTIRPSLSKLCLRRSRYQFVNKSAKDVLTTLLGSCCNQGEYDFPSEEEQGQQGGGQTSPLSALRDFSQGDETDYEFFVRVLASCGLSYHYQMNEAKSSQTNEAVSSPSAPILHIIDALPKDEQLSANSYGNDKQAPTTVPLYYKNIKADNCIGSMMAWEMSQSDGVEGCTVSFGDAGGTQLSSKEVETGKTNVVRLNHVPFDNIRSQGEVATEVGAFLKSMRRNDSVWLGVTTRLEARVGAQLNLWGFYGTVEEDQPSIRDLTIVRTRVRLESPLPAGQLGPWGSAGWRQYVSVGCISTAADAVTDFSALPTGRLGEDETFGGTQASGDFSGVEKAVQASQGTGSGTKIQVNVEEGWRKAAGTADAWQPMTMLVQATVCTSRGEVPSANDASAFRTREGATFYEFYATPDNADAKEKVMVVRYVQPVGGLGQGLFRVPRLGDRILVARCSPAGASLGGINYLMGYLPGEDMPFTANDELKRTEGTALPHEMMSMRFQPASESFLTENLPETDPKVGIRRSRRANDCSEIGFYNTHVGKKWDDGDNVDENFEMSLDDVSKRLHEKSYADLGDDEGMKQEVQDEYKRVQRRRVLANFQSTGNMQLSANENMEVNARNITFKCAWDGWDDDEKGEAKVSFDGINKFIVEAEQEITFKVGRNAISINQTGIAIRSLKFNDVGGPLDSYIYLDALSGTSIGGCSCSLNGFLGVSMGDMLGAGFSAGAGRASISGASITQKTVSQLNAGANFANGIVQACGELAAMVKPSDGVNAGMYATQSAASYLIPIIFKIAMAYKENKDKTRRGEDTIIEALEIISMLADLAALEADAFAHDWLCKPSVPDCFTNRDWFRLTALIFKFMAWGATVAFSTGEELDGSSPWTSATIKLTTGNLEIDADKADQLVRKSDAYNTLSNDLNSLSNHVDGLKNDVRIVQMDANNAGLAPDLNVVNAQDIVG